MNAFREIYLKELTAKQKKIDKNRNGKIDGDDLQKLRKEEQEKKEPLGKGGKVETKKYSWGTMKTVHHGSDFSIPLHPEHHQAIAKLKDQQEHKFKDETGRHWTAKKSGEHVHFQGANNGGKTHVPAHTMHEEYVNEVSSELLDRYKDKAKKSADDLAAKGDYKKSTSRWSNVMKATGKQIDKTTAGIKKALNKEGVDESMADSWKQVQSMDKGSVTSGKEGAKKRLAYLSAVHAHHKKYGNDTKKVKGEIESINRSRIAEEQIDELDKSTLVSYATKAADSAHTFRNTKRGARRLQGIKKAVTRLAKEETEQIDEISQKLAGNYYGAATKKHIDKVGVKPNMYDRIEKDMGKQRKAGVDRAMDRLTGNRKTNEETEMQEGLKPEHKMRPGWMLKADPELKAKVDANKKKYKEFKQNVGKKTNEEVEVIDEQGVASHAELAKSAHNAYVAATRQGNGTMAAHYLKQHLKHKDAAKRKVAQARQAANEEVEVIDERNKENATKRKMMDASRGAKFKLNNPVPDAEAKHKTPQAHNKAIGRALRNEEIVDEACDCEVKPRHTSTEPDMANQATSLQRAKMATNKLAKKTIRTEEVISEEGYTVHSKHTNADGTTTVVLKAPSGKLLKHTGKNVHGYIKSKYGLQSEAKTNDIVCANCGGPVHKGACDDKATWSQKMDKKLNKEQKEIGHDDEAVVKKHLDKIQSPLQRSILKKIQDMQKKRLEIVDNMPTAGGHSAEVNFREEVINMEETSIEYTQEELNLIEQFIEIAEKLNMSKASMGEVIRDFKKSDAPQFAGKSAEKRRQMAIAAKMKSEEVTGDLISLKSYLQNEETLDEIKMADLPKRTIKGKSYGAQYHDPEGDDDADDKPAAKSTEKRGRGRPAGSASGARQKGSAPKSKNSGVEYTGYKLHLPNN